MSTRRAGRKRGSGSGGKKGNSAGTGTTQKQAKDNVALALDILRRVTVKTDLNGIFSEQNSAINDIDEAIEKLQRLRNKIAMDRMGQDEENRQASASDRKRAKSADGENDSTASKRAKVDEEVVELAKSGIRNKETNQAIRNLRTDFEERYLDVVRSVYFRNRQRDSADATPSSSTDRTDSLSSLDFIIPDAGFLSSKLRVTNPFEWWSPLEIALFESALQCFGKKFGRVSKVIPSKTTRQVIDFYYTWKKTSHYGRWKETYKVLV